MKKLNIPIVEVKKELDNVSPSFCLAKWKQVTMHLQTGHTHSCHHPRTHKVPLHELEQNPTALHNTNHKKIQRKDMLDGIRPEECDYCWRVEDSSPDALSDRAYKSADSWAYGYLDEVKNAPWDDNVLPSYVEVSFSSVCNFKCSYCGPQYSTKWMEEIQQHGPYPTSTQFGNIEWLKHADAMSIPHKDENPYVDAFWKWWPEMYTKLHNFRITGGEPLLAKDTFKVLDYIIENPNPNLDFAINSNMCPPEGLLDKFIEKIKIICEEKKVKQFKIFTSAESYGARAEYIRHGLNYEQWLGNIRRILTEVPGCSFTVMSTYNALSVHGYDKFIQDILNIKLEFGRHDRGSSPIILDTPYLRYPNHQAIFILPKELLAPIYDQVTMMYRNLQQADWYGTADRGFYKWEADKFKRIYELIMHKEDEPEVTREQKDFVRFVDEHDLRRGTNFLQTFPELEGVYTKWKAAL
jgi:hypothetical protein